MIKLANRYSTIGKHAFKYVVNSKLKYQLLPFGFYIVWFDNERYRK